MDKVKRPFLLAGLIIDVSVFGVLLIFSLAYVSDEFGYMNWESIFFLITFVLCTLGIIFSSFGLANINKPLDVISKKKSYILTSFIFLCVIILFFLIALLTEFTFVGILILVFLAGVTGAVFTMLGYTKEIGYLGEVNYYQKVDNFDVTVEIIERLTKLKEQNVISEEEYEILKNKQLEILKK